MRENPEIIGAKYVKLSQNFNKIQRIFQKKINKTQKIVHYYKV